MFKFFVIWIFRILNSCKTKLLWYFWSIRMSHLRCSLHFCRLQWRWMMRLQILRVPPEKRSEWYLLEIILFLAFKILSKHQSFSYKATTCSHPRIRAWQEVSDQNVFKCIFTYLNHHSHLFVKPQVRLNSFCEHPVIKTKSSLNYIATKESNVMSISQNILFYFAFIV